MICTQISTVERSDNDVKWGQISDHDDLCKQALRQNEGEVEGRRGETGNKGMDLEFCSFLFSSPTPLENSSLELGYGYT